MSTQNNDIESLMRELVRSSNAMKPRLYRFDQSASTSPDGTDGPTVRVHECRICHRMAAGESAQIRHRAGCELARLQKAQKRLKEVWPGLFEAAKPMEKQKAA